MSTKYTYHQWEILCFHPIWKALPQKEDPIRQRVAPNPLFPSWHWAVFHDRIRIWLRLWGDLQKTSEWNHIWPQSCHTGCLFHIQDHPEPKPLEVQLWSRGFCRCFFFPVPKRFLNQKRSFFLLKNNNCSLPILCKVRLLLLNKTSSLFLIFP